MTVPALYAPAQPAEVTERRAGSANEGWLRSPIPHWTVLGLVIASVAIAIGLPLADGDSVPSLLGSGSSTLRRAGQLPWRAAPMLLAICAFHYLAAALALRSAADLKLPLSRVTQVQLAAAAANRLTPAGLGGAAVNARFLQRSGYSLRRSVGAVAILSGLGALVDILVFLILVLAGRWVGISGGSHELAALFAKLRGPTAILWRLPVVARVALAILIGLTVGLVIARSQRRRKAAHDPSDIAAKGQSPWSLLRELARQPRRLFVLLGASASTTLLLATGFAFTAQLAPVPASLSFGSLLIGYLIGGAVGAAVPAPSGVGATEAALVGVLVAGHMPVASAVSSVLLFRVVTFWSPALIGLVIAKRLRRLRIL